MDKFLVVTHKEEEENEEKVEEVGEPEKEMDGGEIKILRDFIEKKLSVNQKMQVVEIIRKSAAKYTKNKNGYFVNMNNIPDDVLKKIKIFVDFSRDNMKELARTECIMNEEKSRIESIDKEEVNILGEEVGDKNINFEIYSMEGVQSQIFEEFREDLEEEREFMKRQFECEKREESGYKVILKKNKKKYGGSRAKILKNFRDIAKNSIANRNVLQTKKVGKKDVKIVDGEETEEETVAE